MSPITSSPPRVCDMHKTPAPAGAYRSHLISLSATDVPRPSKNVDISVVLDDVVKLRCENLNWRQSIVDLMKILRLDSTKEPRTRLALAVGYDGDVNDSRRMNIWLLSYVKDAIAAVGGDLTGSFIASNSSTECSPLSSRTGGSSGKNVMIS